MLTHLTELQELQELLKNIKECIRRKKQLNELKQNPVFDEIITKGFCIEEMQRCTELSVSEKATDSVRELANQMAKASGVLNNYLNRVIQQGTLAEESIDEVEEAIVRAENVRTDSEGEA